jgi:hypothetical protein
VATPEIPLEVAGADSGANVVDGGTAAFPMSRLAVLAFGMYFIALNITLIYMLIKLWPPVSDANTVGDLNLFGYAFRVFPETRYLLIVGVAGALGSYIHSATSFADFLGNRCLIRSWAWWYLLRPFIGTTLAFMTYFVVRGGLITSGGTSANLSPYGVAAIAGLSGMFSKQATDKLGEIFDTLFKTNDPPRADKLKPRGRPE